MIKLNFFKIVVICFSLVGCTTSGTTKVDVPVVAQCPKANIPPKPHLPIADLKTNSSNSQVVKAYAETVQILKNYITELTELLMSYGN